MCLLVGVIYSSPISNFICVFGTFLVCNGWKCRRPQHDWQHKEPWTFQWYHSVPHQLQPSMGVTSVSSPLDHHPPGGAEFSGPPCWVALKLVIPVHWGIFLFQPNIHIADSSGEYPCDVLVAAKRRGETGLPGEAGAQPQKIFCP